MLAPSSNTIIGHYKLGFEIGSGASSSVHHGFDDLSKTDCAIKIINKYSIEDQKTVTQLQREISILRKVNHPFIAEFYEAFEDENYLYIMMEWVPRGNLLERVNNFGPYSENGARHLFAQLISAIDYLHMYCHIVHRDLKCENVLLDSNNNIKVIDFGLCNRYSSTIPYLSTACGSPAYASPELIRGNKYTHSTDIWSLGVILFAIVVGKLPFDDQDMSKVLEKVCYTDPDYPLNLSPALVDLLQNMLTKDPAHRITLARIKEHPWFPKAEYTANEAAIKNIGMITYFDQAERGIDREIIEKIGQMGIKPSDPTPPFKSTNGECTEKTAVYRILRRIKDNRRTQEIMTSRLQSTNTLESAPKIIGIDPSNRQNHYQTEVINFPLQNIYKNKTFVPKPHTEICPGQQGTKNLMVRPNFKRISVPKSIRRSSLS